MVLMNWFFDQDTSPDVSMKKFVKTFEYKNVRLIGRRDFAWVTGFPCFGMKTTLMCLQLMGI
jgi:hypothetical protein